MLIAALTLAVLYFMLMELLLLDSSRELAEARRFRSRVVASVLAENAVELASVGMVGGGGRTVNEVGDQGTMEAVLRVSGTSFEITGSARTSGTERMSARVFVQGRVESGGVVKIDYTMHGQ